MDDVKKNGQKGQKRLTHIGRFKCAYPVEIRTFILANIQKNEREKISCRNQWDKKVYLICVNIEQCVGECED